ncbi:trehalose-phosphatase [Caldimonas tepidiphila]|uniref:trehalose-phosphatase n=1 Tax=Caldimonas tepidiphila TaxID=2315841 RepID=UPI000E5B74E2|nr:trehalose-phosphatase [Caldimonas tepidiphila]
MQPLPPIDSDSALFLDFDGTLVDLAPRPDAVRVPEGLVRTLEALSRRLGGALAVVSGRPIDELDAFLAPLVLPLAGVHGSERRDAQGRRSTPGDAPAAVLAAVAEARRRAEALAAEHPGLLVEAKPGAVALHYRGAPQLEALCLAAMREITQATPELNLLHGKMVLEAKPSHANKGAAIAAFLQEPPFAGRRPVFAGDDVTDEAGFATVQACGGTTIKVGPGESIAAQRLDGPQALRDWLRDALARLEPTSAMKAPPR